MVILGGCVFLMSEVPLYTAALGFNETLDRTHHIESGPLRAVHLSRHKWPRGLVNYTYPRPMLPSRLESQGGSASVSHVSSSPWYE